ncbi:hypothetical protein Vafri_7118, partial [Volvox africanus]
MCPCCRTPPLSLLHSIFIMVTLLPPATMLGAFARSSSITCRLASVPSVGKAVTFVASSLGISALRWAHTYAHFSTSPTTGLASSGDDAREHDDSTAAGEPAAARLMCTESGRSCESAGAAFRDVMLTRLAALESEVAQLRAAAERRDGRNGNEKQPQGWQQKDRNVEEHRAASAPVAGTEGATDGECGSRGPDGINNGSATEAVAEGLSKLHPKITRLVQS